MRLLHQYKTRTRNLLYTGILLLTFLPLSTLLLPSRFATAATLQATPANLANVFGSASPGDTIELASGSYTFDGGTKTGMVTLRPASGAKVTMSVHFGPAAFITLDHMTISDLGIEGHTHDIAITNNVFTGQANLNMAGNANANILIDHNNFDGITVCKDCAEGRLEVGQYPLGNAPVGVTISNNHFGGAGQSDGVQDGAYGVIIKHNVFDGVAQVSGYTRHIDSIQGYGQSHTTIDGNYFLNFNDGTAIEMPDGGASETITNNVIISPNQNASAIQLGHIQGANILHNTIQDTALDDYVSGVDNSPNNNIVMRDNIMIRAEFESKGCVSCTTDHNLFYRSGDASGANVIVGTPLFENGTPPDSLPTTYLGFMLKPTSPGHGAASDGTDVGPNFSGYDTSTAGVGSGSSTGSTPPDLTGGQLSGSIATLLDNYGKTSGATAAQGDQDGNGTIDLIDLSILLSKG